MVSMRVKPELDWFVEGLVTREVLDHIVHHPSTMAAFFLTKDAPAELAARAGDAGASTELWCWMIMDSVRK